MRHFILLLALVASSITQAAPSTTQAARNVLLMIGDDHGLDGGCFGNASVNTPAFDALAKRGTRFDNAFATVSSCSPSRAVILSGLYTHSNGQYGLAHGQYNQHTLPWVQSLPRVLKAAGYRTTLIGKNHLLPPEVYPYDQTLLGGSRNVSAVANAAAEIFTDTSTGKPFFLVIGFADPHRAGRGFAGDKTFQNVRRAEYDPAKIKVPDHLPDTPEVRRDLADYYQSVNRLDQGVGIVLEELERAGHLDDTLIIYLSDNGRPFPGAKTNLYDAGIHLPLIIRKPGVKGGVVNHAMVSWIDIAPTVLEWTQHIQTRSPIALPGRSLLPILDQENPSGWDHVFASHIFHEIWMYYPMRAIRTRQYKLIWNLAHTLEYPTAGDINRSPSQKSVNKTKMLGQRPLEAYLHRPEFELYDIATDPNELHNLADDASLADVKKDLHQRILKMMADTHDAWNPLINNPHKSVGPAPEE
ncbi:MAG TPA: sulfatase [Tepidisphaeraceae bacterium]|jgi:N-sulfoglucosamine sulfohydrolase